jgi:hypothetical protein
LSSDRPHAVARHFAVVDAYGVDLIRAILTCPSESSSLSTFLPILGQEFYFGVAALAANFCFVSFNLLNV